MRISDWSSDVCSSDLIQTRQPHAVLLASRKGMTGHVFEPAQSHFGKCMPYRLAAGRLVQRTEPGEILLSCQQALDASSMADPQQVACQFTTLSAERPALEQHLACGWLHQAA